MSDLSTYTKPQLRAVVRSIRRSLGSGGCWGWDWPTLHATYPHRCAVLRQAMRLSGDYTRQQLRSYYTA